MHSWLFTATKIYLSESEIVIRAKFGGTPSLNIPSSIKKKYFVLIFIAII
jgi:hypothetical protein